MQGWGRMSKINKKQLLPKLRFPEFQSADEWKANILKNISPAIYDGTHQTPTYIEAGIPFFSVENIVSGNKNKFISREDYLVATSKNKPEKGDILITRIGNIGFSVVIDWDYEFSIYVTLAIIKKSTLFNSYYLNSYFQSDRYQNELRSKSLLNAVPCKINMDELRKTEVLLPPLKPEQQKIADCLTTLDELITAEAGKLEAYKAHKKGLMQKLFPAEGETVPERRFPEFRGKGEWEEKKFGQLCHFVRGPFGGALKKDIFVSDGYAVYEQSHAIYGDFNSFRYFITQEKYKELNRFSVLQGDIIMSCSGTMGKFAVIPETYKEGVINQALLKLTVKTGYHLDFIKFTLELPINQEKLLSQSAGGAIKNVVGVGQMKEIPLCVPKNNEQQKIADCLTSLDDLIIAEARKLEALKAHKKGLMQGLFPPADEVGV